MMASLSYNQASKIAIMQEQDMCASLLGPRPPQANCSTRRWPWELEATQAPPRRVHATLLTK